MGIVYSILFFVIINLLWIPAVFAAQSCDAPPSIKCEGTAEFCAEVVPFVPERGLGYWNYPLNGETEANQYRSFLRRDVIQLIQYAAAQTHCISQKWNFGNRQPLGLGDMSEKDGAIPGTSIGRPGHPEGSHTNGRDLDIAYYQVGTRDNKLRSVCPHTEEGKDVYHCVGEPKYLDQYRTGLFLAKLHDSPNLRVIGVDGMVGPIVQEAIDELCEKKYYTGRACERRTQRIAFETENKGHGWYRFHHHHFHVSYSPTALDNMPPIDEWMPNIRFFVR